MHNDITRNLNRDLKSSLSSDPTIFVSKCTRLHNAIIKIRVTEQYWKIVLLKAQAGKNRNFSSFKSRKRVLRRSSFHTIRQEYCRKEVNMMHMSRICKLESVILLSRTKWKRTVPRIAWSTMMKRKVSKPRK